MGVIDTNIIYGAVLCDLLTAERTGVSLATNKFFLQFVNRLQTNRIYCSGFGLCRSSGHRQCFFFMDYCSIDQNVSCPSKAFVFCRTLRTEFQRRRRQQQPYTGNAT
jgi:hypothetical protein